MDNRSSCANEPEYIFAHKIHYRNTAGNKNTQHEAQQILYPEALVTRKTIIADAQNQTKKGRAVSE